MLVVDPAPEPLLRAEIDSYRELGVAQVVNVRRVREPYRLVEGYGADVEYVDFDGFSADALIEQITAGGEGFEAVKLRAGVPIDERVIAAGCDPGLRRRLTVVARAAAGLDNVDLGAAAARGVTVTHTPGANARAVAEFTVGLMIAAVRRIVPHDAAVRDGRWIDPDLPVPSPSLEGAVLGIVGPGVIGVSVARVARCLGMTVLAYGSHRFTAVDAERLGVLFSAGLDDLLRAADVVSLHAPLTPATTHLINETTLRLMRPDSVLVNTARGGLVDEAALDRALSDPTAPIAAAATDVFAREGSRFDSVLAGNPRCIVTPHVAGMTLPAMAEASRRLAESVRRLLTGQADTMVPGYADPIRVLPADEPGLHRPGRTGLNR
jgi:phosphoglycerate dehydrogenase-like enzyme